jgi:hypothetical protein
MKNVKINSYLRTRAVPEVMWGQMLRRGMNEELEGISQEDVVT